MRGQLPLPPAVSFVRPGVVLAQWTSALSAWSRRSSLASEPAVAARPPSGATAPRGASSPPRTYRPSGKPVRTSPFLGCRSAQRTRRNQGLAGAGRPLVGQERRSRRLSSETAFAAAHRHRRQAYQKDGLAKELVLWAQRLPLCQWNPGEQVGSRAGDILRMRAQAGVLASRWRWCQVGGRGRAGAALAG